MHIFEFTYLKIQSQKQVYHISSLLLPATAISVAVVGQVMFKYGTVRFTESGNHFSMMLFNPSILYRIKFFTLCFYFLCMAIYHDIKSTVNYLTLFFILPVLIVVCLNFKIPI